MANGNGKSSIAKPVALVALGGVATMGMEYATLKASKAYVPAGKVNLNAADAVGTGVSLAEIAIGAATKKPNVTLFGAGGLAAALATIVGKYFIAYNPIGVASATAAQTYTPQTAPNVPAVEQQNQLVVGSKGGNGKIVYKRTTSGQGVNANNPQLFI